ncbi:1-acyl-sn-glycerol-3-phosphate acyltransferase [Erwinia sp. B116]|uniref:lysophospholipid acyltransferase family protein n=1 Tax=Erwinia sp. B116 TaxID=1561024 RepID=UPI000C77F398|nr:lysophospholipid acyltransferase family protein [Erwinia sp. B116]PLV62110.1 acyl-phosphate glycerol 3-phosphate acyltransferase [Erwinia sp. B116]
MSEGVLTVTRGRWLNRGWRLLMTGCCFALFGAGGLLLSLVWFNLLLLIQRDPLRRRQLARRSISWSFRLFLRSARALGVLDYHIDNAELLRSERRCLVVANHPTLIDYVLLASAMPEADCLVKAGLQDNLFFCGVIRAADYLVNSHAETLLPDSQRRLAQGDVIIIFPEGTRSEPGMPLKLQRGAANIAVRSGGDLRLVQIVCSQKTLNKQSRWYHIPPEKPIFRVSVRQHIAIDDFIAGEEETYPRAVRHLTQFLQQALTPVD